MEKKRPGKKYINQLFEKRFIPIASRLPEETLPLMPEDLSSDERVYGHDTVDNFIMERNKYSDF